MCSSQRGELIIILGVKWLSDASRREACKGSIALIIRARADTLQLDSNLSAGGGTRVPAAPIMKICSHALLFCLISSAVALLFCYNLQFDKLVSAILDSLRSLNPSSSGLTSFFNQRLATICFHFYWYSIARVYYNTPHAFSAYNTFRVCEII